jgi:hypothetical protein
MFIMSLAAADITVGGIVMPISSVYAITGKEKRGECYEVAFLSIFYKSKGKAIPLQAWTGPEGPGRLRRPAFKTIGT